MAAVHLLYDIMAFYPFGVRSAAVSGPRHSALTRLTMGRRRRVALAVDDSPGAMRAVRYAAQSLFSREEDVYLVTAVHKTPAAKQPPGVGLKGATGHVSSRLKTVERRDACARAATRGSVYVSRESTRGLLVATGFPSPGYSRLSWAKGLSEGVVVEKR